MSTIRIPRARTAAAIWASVGLVGVAITLYSVLGLAASRGLLHWQFGSGGIGRQMIQFTAGFSLSCMALWGIYKQTIHAREEVSA
jgi:hypothetical protein